MNKILKVLAATAAACVLITSCRAQTQKTAVPVVGGGNASVITEDMQDKTVHLKVGDAFDVQLPTIPRAGYNWQPQDLDTSILSQMGEPVFKPDSEAAGAGGIVTVRFKVVGPGTTALVLIYASAPQGNAPSLSSQSFGLTVVAE